MRGHARDSIYRKNHLINIIMYKSTFIAAAAFMGATLTAFAADPIVMGNENRIIEAGQTYVIEQYKTASGIYNCPADSKIYLDGAQDFRPYNDADHLDPVSVTSLDNIGNMVWFEGEKDKTYYFYTGFPMNTANFTLYQEGVDEKPLEVYIMEPAQNEAVDFNNYPDMVVTFNQDVKLDDNVAELVFANRLTGAEERVETRASATGQMLRVVMYSTLKPFMESGAIKTGDEFKVVVGGISAVTGVAYANADADGNAVFTYLCGSLPVVTVKQQLPSKFLSYWAPGAPEGIVEFEFDAPLMDDGLTYVYLGWGNAEGEGEYYAEEIVCKIEGNTLSADLTGKLRTPATMTPQFPNAMYNQMALDIKNVRDEHGVPVASPGQGTIGSYSYLLPYELISRTNVISEFTPGNGALLKDVDNINIWMTGLDAIKFEGFLLTVTDNDNKVSTRIIPLSEVKQTPTGTNECEYDFTLPADIKASAKRVEITLAGVESLDGYQHDNEVRCIYGGFAILYSEPSNNEELEMLKADSKIIVEGNLSETYPNLYVMYEVIDTDPENEDPVLKSAAWMDRQEDGSYEATLPMDIKLYAGHDYKIVISAWEDEMTYFNSPEAILGSDFILVKGLTPAYHYSQITLTGTDPSTDEMVDSSLSEVTLHFDGFVSLGNYEESKGELKTFINVGQGVTMPLEAVTPFEPMEVDGTVVANQWTLTLPADYMASLSAPLEIDFTAYDQEGVQLRGNKGAEENSFFQLEWKVAGQYAAVEVKAVGGTPLGNVKEFTVYNAEGVSPSWNLPVEDAIVVCDGKTVAHVADIVLPEIPFDEIMSEITLVLDTELYQNTTYTLIIPEGYFVIGEETSVKTSLEVEYEFTITNGVDAVEGIESDDNTFTVYDVAGVKLLDGADADAVRALPAGLYIINGKKHIIR